MYKKSTFDTPELATLTLPVTGTIVINSADLECRFSRHKTKGQMGCLKSGIPVFQLQTERSAALIGLNNTDLGNLEGGGRVRVKTLCLFVAALLYHFLLQCISAVLNKICLFKILLNSV